MKRREFFGIAAAVVAAIPGVKITTALRGTPKIFEMNDCDWVLAYSQEEAATFYLEMIGYQDYMETVDFAEGYPMEVCDEMLDELRFHRESLRSEGSHVVSFREELASQLKSGEAIPHLFASTEY